MSLVMSYYLFHFFNYYFILLYKFNMSLKEYR